MFEMIAIEGQPNEEYRQCYDCFYNRATSVTWHCIHDSAIKERNTDEPNVLGCPYWRPIRKLVDLNWRERFVFNLGHFQFTYFPVDLSSNRLNQYDYQDQNQLRRKTSY